MKNELLTSEYERFDSFISLLINMFWKHTSICLWKNKIGWHNEWKVNMRLCFSYNMQEVLVVSEIRPLVLCIEVYGVFKLDYHPTCWTIAK